MAVDPRDVGADVDHLLAEGYGALEAGRTEQALEILKRARQIDPANPLVHYRIALCHGDRGEVMESLEALDTCLRLDETNAKAQNNRGSALQQLGRTRDAEEAFARALALDPGLVPPYVNLGHLLEKRGAPEQAVALYERAIQHGLDRPMFEQYRAAALGQVTRAAPESWVRSTFDNFAPRFDAHLQALGYDVPRQLAHRVLERISEPLDVVDLGCGTGLCGRALAARKKSLIGVDLSERMLIEAEKLGLYDRLVRAEIHDFMTAQPAHSCDLVICADVFIYVGALDQLFPEVARVLRPGGMFAFSTEEQDRCDFELLASGRYAHSSAYIERLAASRFHVDVADAAPIRMEDSEALLGRLYLLSKPGGAPKRDSDPR